ncbi:MAG: GAF domain-containing protein [Opitutaceae bacterium]
MSEPAAGSPPVSGPTDARRLAALHAVATLAVRGLSPDDLLQSVLDICIGSFAADAGAIALFNPETTTLETAAQRGDFGEAGGPYTLPTGHGVTGWCAQNRRALLVPDVRGDPRYIAARPGARCELAAPLLDGDTLIGVIDLESDRPGGFQPADLPRLEELAAEAARVLALRWRLGHLEAKARQLESLIAAGQSLVARLEPGDLFHAFTREARRMFPQSACALYLHDPALGVLRRASLEGGEWDPEAPAEVPLKDCLCATAIHTRRAVWFPEVADLDRRELRDLPRAPARGSLLAAPLTFEGDVVGVMAVFSGRFHRFDNDEKRLCAAFATLGAVAVQNARLYSRVFQTEDALRRNERLTTLGLLAAEIAHEIRNPLTVIKLLYQGSLRLDYPEGDPRRTDQRVIDEKLVQLEAIVTRVLGFAQAPSNLHSRWPLTDVITDTLALVRLKFSQQKVTVEFPAPARPLFVEGHKGQLQQVLLNLLLNAAQAMPAGGTITLRADVDPATPAVTLDVEDTGGGVPESLQSRIFDSFLSGRPDGTGLGLAIAKRILRSHHGDIHLLRTGETGTTMRIRLPLAP